MDKERLIARINGLDEISFSRFQNIVEPILDLLTEGVNELQGLPIGEKLKEARRNNGLSQEELASKIKVARSSLAELETGKKDRASIQLAKKLSLFFKTKLEYWL